MRQALLVLLGAFLPHELFDLGVKEGSSRAELAPKFKLRPHPEILHVLRVDVNRRVEWDSS